MKIKMNLKNNFKLVPEGQRILEITKAECKPSGKPNALVVTFQDSEGGIINNRYNFDNQGALFSMGMLVSTALGLQDGDDFDTKLDTPKLVGKKLVCEVVHNEGTRPNENGEVPTFANVKKVISLATDEETSVRDAIADITDDDDDLD